MAQLDTTSLLLARQRNWRQTPESRIKDPTEAISFISEVGVATLYPASSEIPNLFHAYLGDPNAVTESTWDSPSGRIYVWRWDIGRANAAFYCTLVRNRPTWISWALLPAVLCLCGETRTPDELFDLGALSAGAYRLAQALDESAEPLSTGELRRQAGFPAGKEHRAAYLRALSELESRLLVAKVFFPEEDDMGHVLVARAYSWAGEEAEGMNRSGALHRFLLAYFPHAAYVVPALLARHLRLPEKELVAGLESLAAQGQVTRRRTGGAADWYIWGELCKEAAR